MQEHPHVYAHMTSMNMLDSTSRKKWLKKLDSGLLRREIFFKGTFS